MTDQLQPPVDGEWVDETHGRVSTATSEPSWHYINESGLPDETILRDTKFLQEVANEVEKWTQSLSGQDRYSQSIDVFARNRWQGARHPFAVMSQCAWAVENDDILSTLTDVVEGLSFKKMRFELNDDDQQDMWNQWAAEVDLDSRLREQFRELFKVSQVYVGLWWEQRIYKVRDTPITQTVEEMRRIRAAQLAAQAPDGTGTDPVQPPAPPVSTGPGRGNRKRKKQFPVEVPTAMTIFDPTKVIPVGQFMFGRERFAYVASEGEDEAFSGAMSGTVVDPLVMQLVEARYNPTPADLTLCGYLGVDVKRLWLLKAGSVYRHTLTRAQYEPLAPVRLKSVLEILDMKANLRASDRAALIGNTNFIVVITKGSDKLPAKAAEIENLREQARIVARLPVLVGDHRLHVEIVAPKMDNTVNEMRWTTLDSRLVFRALQSFQPIIIGGTSGAGSGVSEMSRVVSQGLESRRHMLVRSLERFVFREVMRRNEGVLDEEPSLAFSPKRITLDFNADIVNAILKLRDRGDVSRETTLDEFDYDQDVEVVRRSREKTWYDEVFASATPFSSPAANPYGQPTGGAPGQTPPPPSGAAPEGGRPTGATDTQPRAARGSGAKA